MGRNQLDAQVRASSTHGNDTLLPLKAEPLAKPNKSPVSTPGNSDPATDVTTPPSSEGEFYRVGDKNSSNNHLQPPPALSSSMQPNSIATSSKSTPSSVCRP